MSKKQFHFPLRAIVIASPQDFERCAGPEEQVFSKQEADDAIFSSAGRLKLYLKNFDFVPLVRNATLVKAMRRAAIALDPLVLTKNGDGPLDTDASRGLTYGQITDLRQGCFSALRDIAKQFSDRKIQFALLLTPINPRWVSEYDPNHRVLNSLHSRIAETLKGSDAQIWDASESKLFSEPDFADSIHLRWSAARRLTAVMANFAIRYTH